MKKLIVGALAGLSIMPLFATPTFAEANTKTITIEGQKVSVPVKGNHWVTVKGYTRFIQNGNLIKGWKYMDKSTGEKTAHWSFFDKTNGRLYTGWKTMGKAEGETTTHTSYFGDNGWLRTGWQAMGKGTSNPDGNSAKHWSYFGNNGWLRTGWQQMGTSANPDGNNAKHLSYFGGNGWLVTGNKAIGNATYIFNGSGWQTGTKYTIQKAINQRNTGFGSMGCGGAAGTMAMQANGFNKNLQPNGYYNFFFGSVAKNNDSRYGWNNKSGIWNPALTNWVKGKTGGKAYRVSNLTSGKIKEWLTHGQTVVVLVPSGNITHWVTVYGYKDNTFYIADPWGAAANSATGKTYTLSGSDLDKKLNEAANRKGKKNGEYTREGVTVGEYKLP